MTAAELARACDWSATALGPRSQWPAAVEHVVTTLLEAPVPVCYQHGPSLAMVYNDAFAMLLGAKHPDAFGQPTRVVVAGGVGPAQRRVGVPPGARDRRAVRRARRAAGTAAGAARHVPARLRLLHAGGLAGPRRHRRGGRGPPRPARDHGGRGADPGSRQPREVAGRGCDGRRRVQGRPAPCSVDPPRGGGPDLPARTDVLTRGPRPRGKPPPAWGSSGPPGSARARQPRPWRSACR